METPATRRQLWTAVVLELQDVHAAEQKNGYDASWPSAAVSHTRFNQELHGWALCEVREGRAKEHCLES